jgi:uroporphyrinogen-III synthase
MVRREGGIPHSAPALKEARVDCGAIVMSLLDQLDQRDGNTRRVIVFLTAAGATALFDEAEKQMRLEPLIGALRRNVVVCRGPKPAAVMRRHNISVAGEVAEPYTSCELLQALDDIDVSETDVTLVHYGERSLSLSEALTARGARLHELCVYEWRLPDDIRPLRQLVRDVIDGRMHALLFTSQIQCRHLFQVASEMKLAEPLRSALKSGVIVGVIGPVCRTALEELGVTAQVEPEHPRMAALVIALAQSFRGNG